MDQRTRKAFALVAAAALAALVSADRRPVKAQEGVKARRRPVLSGNEVPIGSLGHPLGTYITIEGVKSDEVLKWTPWIVVSSVNGKPLDEPVSMPIDGFNVADLKSGTKCVFKGYENAQMIGRPPAVRAAAREAGKDLPPGPQAGWQLYLDFHVLKVVEPKGKD